MVSHPAATAYSLMMKSTTTPRIFLTMALLGALGSSCTVVGVVRSPPLTFRSVPRPAVQLGIDIDFYTYPGQDVAAAADADVAYVRSLHANAVSVSFPFFTPGRLSSTVSGTDATPSPHELAVLASAAERAGLYVSIRPLLDEGTSSIGTSRTAWQPADQAAWFASYQKFLLPYARMAQRARIPEFVDGAEFSAFGGSAHWAGLVAALRGVYKGTLEYTNNWGIPLAGNGGPGVSESVDSYQPMNVAADASVAQLTAGWLAYDRTLPQGTVQTEIDVAAVPGAYARPYQVQWTVPRLVPSVQVRWFTAACNAVRADNLGGIYFWSVNFGQSLTSPPTPAAPASWVDGPGARAISACFRLLAG